MNIMVLYALAERKPRKTILDSLYCFSEYDKGNNYYYLDVYDIARIKRISEIKRQKSQVSAIIIHYSMIAMRYDQIWWNNNKDFLIQMVKSFNCINIIIPQDEYNYNNSVKEFIKKANIDYIYTCAYKEDYEILYPKELGYKQIETVYTGYIDEKTLKKIELERDRCERKIDIGYRARKLPYWLGKHGQLKNELAEKFLDYLKSHPNNLVYDIANTGNQNENVILGDDWLKYLLSCRTVLGCLGGSGLLDRDGSIAKKVNEYCMKNPEASFEEVEEKCFKGMDNSLHLFALSPRHFECAMTRTCQVLVEGDYNGVFLPNIDYIEIKRDFSNLPEVIDKIENVKYCQKIAENCYQHVVKTGKFTYLKFVEQVTKNIKEDSNSHFLLELYILCEISRIISIYGRAIYMHIVYKIRALKYLVFRILLRIFRALFQKTRFYAVLKEKWYKSREARIDIQKGE